MFADLSLGTIFSLASQMNGNLLFILCNTFFKSSAKIGGKSMSSIKLSTSIVDMIALFFLDSQSHCLHE